MNFKDFLKTIKTESNKTFLENVVEKAFETIFEADDMVLPDTPAETVALMEKKKKDIETLSKLKVAQDEIVKNEQELEDKFPDFKENS